MTWNLISKKRKWNETEVTEPTISMLKRGAKEVVARFDRSAQV